MKHADRDHARRIVLAYSGDLDTLVASPRLARRYGVEVIAGRGLSPRRAALHAFVDNVQGRVGGTSGLKRYRGDCRIVGRRSPYAYEEEVVTDETGDRCDQAVAVRFLNLSGLSVDTAAKKSPTR